MQKPSDAANWPSKGLILEQTVPAVLAGIVLAFSIIFSAEIIAVFSRNELTIENLYSAVFDWSAIQTGFLFGVYGFVVGKNGGFIEKIRNTLAMQRFVRYTLRATVIGFILTVVCIPLIVTQMRMPPVADYRYYLVAIWAALFVWAFLAFLRVAFIFGALIRVRDEEFIPG